MDLRIITVGKLKSFVEDPAFSELTDAPISPLRAISQAKNPNAAADDPALIIAYDSEEQVLAYFGCLPDQLQNNEPKKICWSSCWWVHPTKGKVAAMPVFYKALQVWNAKMLFDALPERSEAVLDKMGYFSFRKIDGLHSFLRFKFHKIISKRIPLLAPLKNIFYVVDTLLNIPLQARLSFLKRKTKPENNIHLKRIAKVDLETERFIQANTENEFPQRKASTFNWIIQNPWLTTNKSFTKKYFFSSHADHFENFLFKVYKDNEMIAFFWLTLRDGTAKLPYCYISQGYESTIAQVLKHQLYTLPIDTFICFQQNILPALAETKTAFLYKKAVSKTFGWTNTLDTYFESDFYLQDGDGDAVFT